MNKKIVFQITLFLLLIIIIFFFYYEYFFINKERASLITRDLNVIINKSENNVIKNLEYSSIDKSGNKYLITSEYGELSSDGGSIISMTNVIAKIDLFEKDNVYISSDFAIYNTLNFDTNFSKNVILEYTQHEISSDNLDLSFKENFVWVSNNIIYKSSTNQLFADKLNIDLLTKSGTEAKEIQEVWLTHCRWSRVNRWSPWRLYSILSKTSSNYGCESEPF